MRKVKYSFTLHPDAKYEYYKSAQVSNGLGNSLDNRYATTIIPKGHYTYIYIRIEEERGYSSQENQTRLSLCTPRNLVSHEITDEPLLSPTNDTESTATSESYSFHSLGGKLAPAQYKFGTIHLPGIYMLHYRDRDKRLACNETKRGEHRT